MFSDVFVYPRYRLSKVALVVCLFSFAMFLFAYVSSVVIISKPFNWEGYREYLVNQVLGTLCTIFFFYVTLNLYHRFFAGRRQWGRFIPLIVASYVAVAGYNFLIDYLKPLSSNMGAHALPFRKQLFGNSIVALTYIGVGLLLAYVGNLRDVRRKHRILEAQKLQLEVEKAQAELKFLKSQINPHFLHNTLNSFYARALPLSPDLAEGILTLSEMMRYALKEDNRADGKVLLRDEIEHLRNLVKIHQFRFRNKLNIELEVTGVINGLTIPPFILITLVENIFKHGDLTHPEHPIHIKISVDKGRLRYYSRNLKKAGPRELSTGIGLDNIQRQLQLVYGEGFRLQVTEEQSVYTTELIIEQL